MVHVGDDGDVANTWIQIKNSSGLQIGAYYYFTMSARFGVAERSDRMVTGLRPVPAGQSPATTQALPPHSFATTLKLQQTGGNGALFL
jgi:hypothetical protein